MKIKLDQTKCTGLGICESLAPTVFEVNDDGELVLLTEVVTDELLEDVKKACEGCPTEALTLVTE